MTARPLQPGRVAQLRQVASAGRTFLGRLQKGGATCFALARTQETNNNLEIRLLIYFWLLFFAKKAEHSRASAHPREQRMGKKGQKQPQASQKGEKEPQAAPLPSWGRGEAPPQKVGGGGVEMQTACKSEGLASLKS